MIDLINRLTVWNSWKTPKDREYIDFFVVNENTIDIKMDKKDNLALSIMVVESKDKNSFCIFKKYIDYDNVSKLEILEKEISTFNVMEFLTYHINSV